MAFYPHQFPAIYAYPMPFPANQEFYAMYPHGHPPPHPPPPHGSQDSAVYYSDVAPGQTHLPGAGHSHGHYINHGTGTRPPSVKYGFANRKDSADSGISDFSFSGSSVSGGMNSRKVSNTSTISNASIMEESALENVGEEGAEAAEEENLPPMEKPDDDTCEKIVAQVEFYFSDANITKDKFLLKHVKRNKEGFVSLKLISSFKRVKHLTKDWRQVAYAVERKSDKLEVNDVKTKVRRLEALPEYDETTPSRTVVALDLPLDRPTIEGVAEIFSACGDIVLVRILRPGNPIPADIKPFANKHPEMTAKVCALVEFERTEFAHKAVKELNGKESDSTDDSKKVEGGMKVMELTAPPPKSTKNKEAAEKKKSIALAKQQQQQQQQVPRRFSHAGFGFGGGNGGFQQQQQQQQDASSSFGARRKISLMPNMKFSDHHAQKSQANSLNPDAPSFNYGPPIMTSHGSYMGQRRISRPPFVHPAFELAAAGHLMHPAAAAAAAAAHAAAASAAGSGWVSRRISTNELSSSGLAMPHNVVRLPRGPEKNGRGFNSPRWVRPGAVAAQAAAAAAAASAAAPVKKASRAVPIVAPPPAVASPAAKKEAASKKPEEEKKAEAAAEAAAPEAAVAAAPAAVADNESARGSDSGNEDGGFSDSDLMAGENERTR